MAAAIAAMAAPIPANQHSMVLAWRRISPVTYHILPVGQQAGPAGTGG
jgi:hypothetical protein